MLVGYNTNVPYKGTVYHVQTEDSGLKNPVVITLLYLKGTILSSKKTNYGDLASDTDYKEKVREIMKEQHKSMIKELIAGKHPSGVSDPEPVTDIAVCTQQAAEPPEPKHEAKVQISKSLDDILLDYIIKGNE